ncbi:MAG: ATP-binding protein [Chitinophagales bacterium]
MTGKIDNISSELPKHKFESFYRKAIAYKEKKDFVKALEAYSTLIAFQQHKEDCVECANLYEDIGDIYFELKEYQRAFEYLQKAAQIYIDNHATDLYLKQLKKIGSLQQGIWQFKKALDVFHQGYALAKRLKNSEKIIEFELLIGNALNWDDQLEESEKFLKKIVDKNVKVETPLIKLRAYASYAILLRKMKKYKLAEKYFKHSLQLSLLNNNAYLMDIYKSYGVLLYEKGNFPEAERFLLQAEEMADKEGHHTSRAVIFEFLAELYEKTKQYKKSNFYLKKFYENKFNLLEKGYSDDNNILQIKLGLQDAKRERTIAEETTNAKSLFIASISHEIRTPMNIIMGTTSLMLNNSPKKSEIKYLNILKKSSENLLGIINDVLDVSKIDAGKLEIELEPVFLQDILNDIVELFQPQTKEKGIDLKLSIDRNLNFSFYADAMRLNQIFTNLVSNAIKFTSKGAVSIDVRLLPEDKLHISVSDSGIGMSIAEQKLVFSEYEQIKNSAQRKYKGTGLGLAIAKKLVELMDGIISVKSRKNKGTTFTVVLPYKKAKATLQKQKNPSIKKADFLNGKSILIADDENDNRFVLVEILRLLNKNVNIVEAENGLQAMQILQKQKIDLVLMDLEMPIKNGFETIATIRQQKNLKTIKVVASTASIIADVNEDILASGFDAFLPKPFTMDDFYSCLEKLLR